MAKALELNAEALAAAQPVPRASKATVPATAPKRGMPEAKAGRTPLQVRWPAKDVKAAKLAAIQLDFPTVSEFMLACFHDYMKTRREV